ncbi:MAG: ribonuclease P [Candidatus Micrarchaeota archaeon]|nr:ribonuclease P [Candidatus Micrarchaeota archaeon]
MQKKDPIVKEVATWRIQRLFELASIGTKRGEKESLRLARRYVRIAKAISSHYKAKMPDKVKNSICKKCGSILIPGLNCRVRLASSKRYIIYLCRCGEEKHIFYK